MVKVLINKSIHLRCTPNVRQTLTFGGALYIFTKNSGYVANRYLSSLFDNILENMKFKRVSIILLIIYAKELFTGLVYARDLATMSAAVLHLVESYRGRQVMAEKANAFGRGM
jgi:hypothetical protein